MSDDAADLIAADRYLLSCLFPAHLVNRLSDEQAREAASLYARCMDLVYEGAMS